MSAVATPPAARLADLQARFLALTPRIETHARIAFRGVRCPHRRCDCIAEAVSICWKWFVRLAERGKDAAAFVSRLVDYAVRWVRSGRRLAGQEKAKDVLSPAAQRRHGFAVEPLARSTRRSYYDLYALVRGQQAIDAYEERLHAPQLTPPPEAAAFRLDFPQFLAGLPQRDRELAMYLALGHGTLRAARRFNLSPGRVSQLRRHWCAAWRRFGDGTAAPAPRPRMARRGVRR